MIKIKGQVFTCPLSFYVAPRRFEHQGNDFPFHLIRKFFKKALLFARKTKLKWAFD